MLLVYYVVSGSCSVKQVVAQMKLWNLKSCEGLPHVMLVAGSRARE